MFDGRSVELQVRTNLQHSWATTIEAVGLYRGEALKSRQGSEEWLRLFTLMSAEFAESENCATPDSTPEKATRRTEIRDLARSQDAVAVLDTVSRGFNGTDLPLAHEYKPSHFLIRYDRVKRKVTVEPHNMALSATRSYDLAENASNQTGSEDESIVLVEVDKIDKLREAYPNYFGDVTKFKTCLEELVLGRPAFEYVGPTRQPKPRLDTPAGDSAWLRGAKFPRPSLKPVKR